MKRLLNSTAALSVALMNIHPWPLMAQSLTDTGAVIAADGTILCTPSADAACDPNDPDLIAQSEKIDAQIAKAAADAQAKADAEAAAAADAQAKADAEAASTRHARELKQAKDAYNTQKIEYESRHSLDLADANWLRLQSEKRADLYRGQARAGSTAAAALADHAAQLDASLAEGREVAIGLRRDIEGLHALLILAKADADAARRAAGQ